MKLAAKILVAFVALEHVAFLVLEMLLWTTDTGRKVFGTTPEFAEASKALAMNQGLYNGFLAAALVVALVVKDAALSKAFATFGLACVVVAGLFGGVTAKIDILFVQMLPALVALVVVRVSGGVR